MPVCQDVASYILVLASRADMPVCNMKLQKLLYYCQGFSLGIRNSVLYEHRISAWDHGPVVESVYHQFKQFGKNQLPIPQDFDDSVFDNIQKDIIRSVVCNFGRKSAWELREMTHNEPTWLAHSLPDEKGDLCEITVEEMYDYFSSPLSIESYYHDFKKSAASFLNEASIEIPNSISSSEEFISWVRQAK